MEKWQSEWDSSEKGRTVYSLCKEVGVDRLALSFKGTQLLTGHGNLKSLAWSVVMGVVVMAGVRKQESMFGRIVSGRRIYG